MPAAAPETRAERGARTRRALLDSAQEAFLEQGLDAASVDRIARGAGFTKGAFYTHFDSKRALVLALLDERFSTQIERFRDKLAGVGEPGEETMAAATDFVENTLSDSDWTSLFLQFAAYAARDEDFRAEFVGRYKLHQEQLADLLGRWNPRLAELGGQRPIEASVMVFALTNGFILERLIDPGIDDALFGESLLIFLRGFEALSAERGATLPFSAPRD
jgi:AcrR family transcriptional regulator